eukprot:TRINITY_DN7060_c0_g1_i2.p1 TRINITY_DN7060_c0_g1~~TRINITY_DN7060_c0_g1_i2.p1  ORF type:complete len:532 (+),score=86.41 TRINITY_DN7060_c0_g1_i2:159-1754(+)
MSGPVAGGNLITVFGTDLSNGTFSDVRCLEFNGILVSLCTTQLLNVTPTAIVAVVPKAPYHVSLRVYPLYNGQKYADPCIDLYTFNTPGVMTSVTPQTDSLQGGANVTIVGFFSNLDTDIEVVTLAGVQADIIQPATSASTVVVRAAASPAVVSGTVEVCSKSLGCTTGFVFSYEATFPLALVLASAIVGVAILVVGVVYLLCRKSLESDESSRLLPVTFSQATSASWHPTDRASINWQMDFGDSNVFDEAAVTTPSEIPPRIKPWTFDWKDLLVGEHLGRGAYGEVFRAVLWGTTVAVKQLRQRDQIMIDDFTREVQVLSVLRHPNIVLFLAASLDGLAIATELIKNGSLFNLIHSRPQIVTLEAAVRIARGIARGMSYLHSRKPPIIHRDLKSANVLMDDLFEPKIADFGLACVRSGSFANSLAGSPAWMAPEVLSSDRYTEACDVYSWGVVLWEMLTHRVPYDGVEPMRILASKMFPTDDYALYRDMPPGLPDYLVNLVRDTTLRDPTLRPSFEKIVDILVQSAHDLG